MADEREAFVRRGLRFTLVDEERKGWHVDTRPAAMLYPGDALTLNERTPAAVRFANVDGRIVDDYVGTWTPDGIEPEEPANDRSLFCDLWNAPTWLVDELPPLDVELRPGALDGLRETALERLCRGLDIPIELVNPRPWAGG